jgi:gas vesicle protein
VSWFLDYIIRAKNDAKPAVTEAAKDLEKLEKQTEETQKATQKWTAQQQRSAMAMASVHEQALKMNAALSQTSGLDKMKAAFTQLGTGGGISGALGALGPAGIAASAGLTVAAGAAYKIAGAIDKLAGDAENWTNIAKSTGLGVVQVQQLGGLLEDAGIPADALKVAMKSLSSEVATGGKKLEQFGVSIKGWDLMSQEERLRAMARIIADVEDPATQSALAVAAFGRSGAELIPVMEDVASGADKLYGALDERAAASLVAADAKIDQFKRKLGDAKKSILAAAVDIAQGIQFGPGGMVMVMPNVDAMVAAANASTPSPAKAPSQGEVERQERERAARSKAEREKADKERERMAKRLADSLDKLEEKHTEKVIAEAAKQTAVWERAVAAEAALTAAGMAEEEAALEKWQRREEKATEDAAAVKHWAYQQRMQDIEDERAREEELIEQNYAGMMDLLGAVQEFGDAVGGTFGGIVSAGAGAMQTFMSIAKAINEGATGLQKMAMGAQALTAAYKSGSVGGGAMTGAAAGLALGGPIGGAIGGIVGGIAGLFGKGKKEKQERAEVDEARRALIETAGGIEQLRAKADMAGISLSKMLNAKKARDYEAAVKDVKRALDLQDEAQEKINAAVQKYGLTIEDLGPAWARQELDTRAAGILESYKLLEAKGADMHAVLAKMGPDVNDYVQQSIRAGTAIPEAMRPIIEQLIQSGQLLDENGEAYGSLEDAGVTFADSMTDTFKSMNEAMWELVRVMGGEVPAAIRRAGEAAGAAARQAGGITGEASNDNYTEEPIYAAAGYSGWVSRPTRFVAGEGGQPEHVQVTPRSAMSAGGGAAPAASGGSARPIVVQMELDKRVFGQVMLNMTTNGAVQVDASASRRRG